MTREKYFFLKRSFLLTGTLFLALSSLFLFADDIAQMNSVSVAEQLVELEASVGGRLGVFAVNTINNKIIEYRADERFPMCSTFKMMVAATILNASMTHPHLLEKKVIYTKEDLAGDWNPITKEHVTDGMTISALCAAAMTQSDNAAANLLMKKLGGPSAITTFARSIGDDAFRLDRWEPGLNTAIPGDDHDTTTPKAMALSLEKLTLGNVLAPSKREQLQNWLKANTTGNNCIRAGTPLEWSVGDKTGAGDYGTRNDIALLWPPQGSPVILAIYFTQPKKDAPRRDDVIASATRIVLKDISR